MSVPASLARFDRGQHCRSVPLDHRVEERFGKLPPGRAERSVEGGRIDRFSAGKGRRLFEHRQRVAQAAVGAVGDRRECSRIDRDPLGGGDLAHPLDHYGHGDPRKGIPLATGEHRNGEFFGRGRGENEDGMRRRLLERLEEGVRTRGAEHVRLIDDVDFHPHRRRRKLYGFTKRPDIVDAVVAGGVDLEHVEGRSRQDRPTILAGVIRRRRWTVDAVDASGQDFRRRRLAGTARTGK